MSVQSRFSTAFSPDCPYGGRSDAGILRVENVSNGKEVTAVGFSFVETDIGKAFSEISRDFESLKSRVFHADYLEYISLSSIEFKT